MATMVVGGDITGVYSPTRGLGKRSMWNGATPEVFFAKRIDNSRLVKVADPQRAREIKALSYACVLFFAVFLTYAWQHFRYIEYSYRVESQRVQLDKLTEAHKVLELQQAQLRDPQRIDILARKMGMVAARPGQFVSLDATADSQPILASLMPDNSTHR